MIIRCWLVKRTNNIKLLGVLALLKVKKSLPSDKDVTYTLYGRTVNLSYFRTIPVYSLHISSRDVNVNPVAIVMVETAAEQLL